MANKLGSKATDLNELIYYGAIKLEITAGIPTWEVAHRYAAPIYGLSHSDFNKANG